MRSLAVGVDDERGVEHVTSVSGKPRKTHVSSSEFLRSVHPENGRELAA